MIEESGSCKMTPEEEAKYYKQLNFDFLNYIKLRKVVQLEDLAQNFKMTTQEAVHRINSLELNKMLTGVIDERGKYIYITQQEFEAVMNYIKIKGRVNKADLLQECNNLIKLDPSESDKNLIMNEEKKILEEVESEFQIAPEVK